MSRPTRSALLILLFFLVDAAHVVRAADPTQAPWFVDGRPTRAALELVSELNHAERRGLRSTDYRARELQAAVAASGRSGPADLGRLGEAISVAAARFVSDLHSGRVLPSEVGYDLDAPAPRPDAAAAVQAIAHSTSVPLTLDGFEPRLRHYALLKSALWRYQALASSSAALTQLPPFPKASIKPGQPYAGLPAVRTLLKALGDMEPGTQPVSPDSALLDPPLVTALKHFQARHGLDADGVLGKATYEALVVPFADRVRQIELTMERIRWLPPFETPPIIVNIPQFRLFAFKSLDDVADQILQMDVIVGSTFEGRHTPVFAATLRFVVLRPYWDVPRSILVKEVLPDIRRNPAYLEDNDYEIVRGEGDDSPVLPSTAQNLRLLEQGGARLRQKPGAKNALGRVKFMFPNRHNVYLHDTPSRNLFQRSQRAFSHGCIRVSDPMALLEHVMRNDPQWSEGRRDEALARSTPTRVPLLHPLRVFILYGTALAKEDGTVGFFRDIYGHDAVLLRKLEQRS